MALASSAIALASAAFLAISAHCAWVLTSIANACLTHAAHIFVRWRLSAAAVRLFCRQCGNARGVPTMDRVVTLAPRDAQRALAASVARAQNQSSR